MTIKNLTSNTVSWFCFNHLDSMKIIALASGDLDKDNSKDYSPPENEDGFYTVRFTVKGGGTELATGTVSTDGTITLEESNDNYSVKVDS